MFKTKSFWQRRLFWGIRTWELAAFVCMHVALAVLYYITIWLTASQAQLASITINYSFKMLLTAPFWWLFFRKLRTSPFHLKAWLHLPSCVLFVATWLFIYINTLDILELPRLRGAGIWWDVYIPVLVYLIQFGIFHAYFYWTETLRQQEREKALMQTAHTAELNTLKAQIQPHFLFNTLNSISSSLPSSEEKTRTLIAQLADVFRFAMNVTDKEKISLEKELAFIKSYLALEQYRFGDRLSITYNIDEGLSQYSLPPMVLQPLVENALKHGIAKSLEGGRITITIKRQETALYFSISDSGKGINGTPPGQLFQKGIGLENTRQRLLRLYNTPLHIEALQPRGCIVYFSLPL